MTFFAGARVKKRLKLCIEMKLFHFAWLKWNNVPLIIFQFLFTAFWINFFTIWTISKSCYYNCFLQNAFLEAIWLVDSPLNIDYSKALRYTASSCTDLAGARFWIGSKNIWDARFCTFLHVFLINEYLRCTFLMNEYLRCTFLHVFCTFFSTWVLEIHDTPIK